MGALVKGQWRSGGLVDTAGDGSFVRADAGFRDWIARDGAPGPDGRTARPATPGRYRLYVSHACPWAHRTLIVRALLDLGNGLPVSVVDPVMLDQGWTFGTTRGGSGDPLHGADFLWQLYARARPDYTGKATVPVLWDTADETIVSNESAEIIRMLPALAQGDENAFYPPALAAEIDAVNARVYDTLNNGVYRAGFATSQAAHEAAIGPLFDTLSWLEDRLATRQWLVGHRMTEADIRLFTTLVRFDAVYHGHFKCNVRRVADQPALQAYLERLLAIPAIGATVHLDHIKTHYYASHRALNPSGIVPVGPALGWLPRTAGGDQHLT